jgi:capsular polysaccharide biosynthesis protein
MSPRKFAKALLFHTRRAQIRTLSAPREVPWLRRRLRLPANETFEPLRDDLPSVRLVALDPAASFVRPMPLFDGAPPEAVAFFADRRVESTAPTYVAEFQDGVAWGHPTGGIFTAEGRFVPAFTHDPGGPKSHTVWTRLRLPEPRRLAGRTLYLVTPEATDNFHHWLIDLLPRLGLVQRAGYPVGHFDHVIVNHAHRPYQRATLAHLGIPSEKIMVATEDLFLRCESLVVPSLKPNHQTMPAADLAFLRGAFLQDLPAGTPHRKIFLSRGDARFRRLTNEAALKPLLRSHGFEIISPADLDFMAQARLFAESTMIAGPAGAAFANLVFASPPAHVVEIAPPQWLAAFHWMISARSGLEHTILLGDGPVMRGIPDSSARQANITLPREKLEAVLRRPAPMPSAQKSGVSPSV